MSDDDRMCAGTWAPGPTLRYTLRWLDASGPRAVTVATIAEANAAIRDIVGCEKSALESLVVTETALAKGES